MRIQIRKVVAGKAILAGASAGRELLAKLVGELMSDAPAVCYLDFAGVELATISFLRESVIAFREVGMSRRPPLYLVVANANDAVVEELSVFLSATQDALWLCSLDEGGAPRGGRVLGLLDAVHEDTLKLVRDSGEVDAPRLATAIPEVRATAWNNRLATLARRGLLMERQVKKTKLYRAPVEVE